MILQASRFSCRDALNELKVDLKRSILKIWTQVKVTEKVMLQWIRIGELNASSVFSALAYFYLNTRSGRGGADFAHPSCFSLITRAANTILKLRTAWIVDCAGAGRSRLYIALLTADYNGFESNFVRKLKNVQAILWSKNFENWPVKIWVMSVLTQYCDCRVSRVDRSRFSRRHLTLSKLLTAIFIVGLTRNSPSYSKMYILSYSEGKKGNRPVTFWVIGVYTQKSRSYGRFDHIWPWRCWPRVMKFTHNRVPQGPHLPSKFRL